VLLVERDQELPLCGHLCPPPPRDGSVTEPASVVARTSARPRRLPAHPDPGRVR
jgi:hypothetical protein